MWAYAVVAAPGVLGLALALAVYMPAPGTKPAVRLNCFLAWAAALSVVLLVPSDLAEAMRHAGAGPPEDAPQAVLRGLWMYSYWYCFLAMFFILPLHQAYEDSGEFGVPRRILRALKATSVLYGVLGAAAALALGVLLLTQRVSPGAVKGLVIACSNLFGIVATVFLLGHGLVELPRELWRKGNLAGRQRLSWHRLGANADRFFDAKRELERQERSLADADTYFTRRDPMREHVDVVLAEWRAWVARNPQYEPNRGDPGGGEFALEYGDRAELAQVRRNLERAREEYDRRRHVYVRDVQAALRIEDIVMNTKAISREYRPRYSEPPPRGARALWWWHCRLKAFAYRAAALACAFLSVAFALSELTIYPRLPNWFQGLSLFSWALRACNGNPLLTEVVALILFAYPCAATFFSLFRMSIGSYYVLTRGHSSAVCLFSNALFMCRLSQPMAFNFMFASAPMAAGSWPGVDDTAFWDLFGKYMIDLEILGDVLGVLSVGFTVLVPALLIPYMVLQYFNLFDRLVTACCGCCIQRFSKTMKFSWRRDDDDGWETSPNIEKGLRLLETEKAAVESRGLGAELGTSLDGGPGAVRLRVGRPSGAGAGAPPVAPRPVAGFGRKLKALFGKGAEAEEDARALLNPEAGGRSGGYGRTERAAAVDVNAPRPRIQLSPSQGARQAAAGRGNPSQESLGAAPTAAEQLDDIFGHLG